VASAFGSDTACIGYERVAAPPLVSALAAFKQALVMRDTAKEAKAVKAAGKTKASDDPPKAKKAKKAKA